MARINLLGVTGFAVSAASIPLFIGWVWLSTLGFGSGESNLTRDLNIIIGDLSLLFMVGAILSLFSPLAGLLEIPAVVMIPLWFWHGDPVDSWLYPLYSIALIGCAATVSSMFLQVYTGNDNEWKLPWYRTWTLASRRSERASEHKLVRLRVIKPKMARRWLAVTIVVAVAIPTCFSVYVLTQPVSTLRVEALFAPDRYGQELNVTMSVDGKIVSSDHVVTEYGMLVFVSDVRVDAGSHEIGLDFANSTTTLDGTSEWSGKVKVLPFTLELKRLGFGGTGWI